MQLQIVRENIVHMHTDAIVNAANSSLKASGGVCGSIFNVAGFDKMESACNKIGYCKTGQAVITEGFNLQAKYVIHAVGPIWSGGNNGEEELLRSCYKSAFKLAKEYKLESIAFPLISSGIYGYPKAEALSVAISEISTFLMENEMLVYIVVYDRNSFRLSQKVFNSIASYIDDKYVSDRENHPHLRPGILTGTAMARMMSNVGVVGETDDKGSVSFGGRKRNLSELLAEIDETFSESLIRLIDEKGKSDVEVYKRANIDRKHFSKIRSNKDYKPTKPTVLAFAIALELSLDETKDLLARAGYALSHSSKFDVVIEYFILEKNYNIFEINEALFAFDLPILG